MALPAELEQRVVTRLFQDADELDWAHLSATARSAQYAKWVQDAEVGGRLTQFMTSEQARVWIKDGPMKEWARAGSGIGKYAPLVPDAGATPAQLVHMALRTRLAGARPDPADQAAPHQRYLRRR